MPNDKKHILCFGALGQLGQESEILFSKDKNFELTLADKDECDLTKIETIQPFIEQIQPDLIINCSAYTDVEGAEEQKDLAFLINATAVDEMAKAGQSLNIPLIHVSTDYVFDGQGNAPIFPNAEANPINVYGASKLEGENLIKQSLEKHIIIRTSWLYSVHGKNFVKTMLCLGQKREDLSIITDQYGCPTSAGSLAKAIYDITNKILFDHVEEWGIYHFSNPKSTNWYSFAAEIFSQARAYGIKIKVKNLAPVSSAEFQTKAARPTYSVMNVEKIQDNYGVDVSEWTKELDKVMQVLTKS